MEIIPRVKETATLGLVTATKTLPIPPPRPLPWPALLPFLDFDQILLPCYSLFEQYQFRHKVLDLSLLSCKRLLALREVTIGDYLVKEDFLLFKS